MIEINAVLVATDFSENAHEAVDTAMAIAKCPTNPRPMIPPNGVSSSTSGTGKETVTITG